MSITSSKNLAEENKLSDNSDKLISWIFIKSEKLSKDDQFEDFLKRHRDLRITQAYSIFGEYNFILKIHTGSITDVDDFLIRCQREEDISTSTKCVLTVLKDDEGGLSGRDVKKKKNEANRIKNEADYAVARIMANTSGFIQKSKYDQKKYLDTKLKYMGIPTPKNRRTFTRS